jgi:hypothetical protein
MSVIRDLTPLNLLSEKEKFFADFSYNPQFVYESTIDPATLLKYGATNDETYQLAQEIIQRTYFGRNDADLEMSEGRVIPQHEAQKKIEAFLAMHDLKDRYEIRWSNTFVARASINKTTLRLRLPAHFRRDGLLGMIYHEIGTHGIRQINYEQQEWYEQKKNYGFSEYLVSEEGLAVLHSLLPVSLKYAYRPARHYIGVHLASVNSFAELWEKLTPVIPNPEKRWTNCVRQKRGLTDTSLPGGFTKDLVYLEGTIKVIRWMKTHNFDLSKIYFGKIAVEDAEKAFELNPSFEPLLPSFFKLNPEKYQKSIEEIATINTIM